MNTPISLALALAFMLAAILPAPPRAGAGEGAPAVLSREAWGAKRARPGLKPHAVSGLIVHHTGTRADRRRAFAEKLRGLQVFSQRDDKLASGKRKPAWPDLPYHFYIDWSGAVAEGRDVRFAGDTNTNYDPSGYVQVVLEGNFDAETPTDEQLGALGQVLRWQMREQRLPASAISLHKDHARTACPGRNLVAVMPGLLADLRSGK